jgi:hypothetical protein
MICRKMRCLRRQKLACGCPLRTSVRGIADSGRASCSVIAHAVDRDGCRWRRRLRAKTRNLPHGSTPISCLDPCEDTAQGSFGPRLASRVHDRAPHGHRARIVRDVRASVAKSRRRSRLQATAAWQDAQTFETWAVHCPDCDRRCRMRERGASRWFRSVHWRVPTRGALPADVSEATSDRSVDGRVFELTRLAWERSIAHRAAQWTCRQAGLRRCDGCCCQRQSSKRRSGRWRRRP